MDQENGQERHAEPRLSPSLSEPWEKIRAGTHHGEFFEVTVTEWEMEDAVAGFLEGRPEILFRKPQVSVDLNGVEARGLVHLGALKLPVSGRANITVQSGQTGSRLLG